MSPWEILGRVVVALIGLAFVVLATLPDADDDAAPPLFFLVGLALKGSALFFLAALGWLL